MDNFIHHGDISNLLQLKEMLKRNMPDRESLRELVPNQKDTRVKIGLYNILDDIYGFGDKKVFDNFYTLLKPVLNSVANNYGYDMVECRSLLIVKLLKDGVIDEHIDEAGIYKYAHRVHIPLITNEGCIFKVGDELKHMREGEVYEINNTIPHSVTNGSVDRVHIIMDIMGIRDGWNEKILLNEVPDGFYMDKE